MTLRQAIVRNIKMFRAIPGRSLLWLDLPGAGDLVECREVSNLSDLLSRFGHPESVLGHLDTPDGDFEDTFRIRVSDLQNPPVLASKRNGAQLARDKVVARFGLKKIDNVEIQRKCLWFMTYWKTSRLASLWSALLLPGLQAYWY